MGGFKPGHWNSARGLETTTKATLAQLAYPDRRADTRVLIKRSAKKTMAHIVYYEPSDPANSATRFRAGEAWMVSMAPDARAEDNSRVLRLSPHTYRGLFHLGVIEKLRRLPQDFPIGDYEEGALFPDGLLEAAAILERVAGDLGDEPVDALCFTQVRPDWIEYRMRLEPEELKKAFLELAAFFRESHQKHCGVQLWL